VFVLRGASFVAVVQATELGNRDDAAIGGRSHRPRDRRVFVERKMCSGAQVVLQVGVQDAAQPAFIADDDMIKALPANGPDKSHAKQYGCAAAEL
jgi:hypothetical protein